MGNYHIFKLLSSNGDGTGTTNAIGDYSVTPLSLKYGPSSTEDVEIGRMIVKIEDAGTFDADKYGNNITLTNGIRCYVKDSSDAVIEEITAFPIISSGDWAGHCHDVTLHSFGTGNNVLTVRWTFSRSGHPIELHLTNGQYFEIYLNDDFTGLIEHRFQIQGYFKDEFY